MASLVLSNVVEVKMKQSDIDALAHQHTLAVLAIGRNFEAISKDMIERRGTWAGAEGVDVLTSLLGSKTLPHDTAQHVARAAHLGERLPSIVKLFTPGQKKIISAVEHRMIGTDADGAIKALRELQAMAKRGSDLELIFKIATAIVADGKQQLYEPAAFAKLTGLDGREGTVATARSSAGEVLADDVAGAVVGGLAGAVATWWAGSGPGAAGGAIGGAIMFSGKALWENAKIWWDGVHHGENDPAGPIGGEHLPDEI